MTAEQAVAYLLDHELLAPRDIVRGEVRVSDRSARNTGLLVHCTTRSGYFVKQGTAEGGAGSVAREAVLYTGAQRDGALAALRPWVPALRRYDAKRTLLVLELIDRAPTARAAAHGTTHDASAEGLAAYAAVLGVALATCHAIARADDADARASFSLMAPWAFQLLFPGPAAFRDLSALQLEIIKLLQRDEDLSVRVRAIRDAWTFECLTHGDVRWDNVLVVAPSEAGAGPTVRMIDWEHVGLGDPAWDVACAWQGWISHGIETLQLGENDDPATASHQFAAALPALQVQMRRSWDTYAATTALNAEARRALLERACSYVPLRLVQTAWEWARERQKMTPFILLTLQLAVNQLRRPAAETAALVGVGAQSLA